MVSQNVNVLETLYQARASLADKPFEFMDWTHCTCGHIYHAAEGRWASYGAFVSDPEMYTRTSAVYAEVIETVARALGWKDPRGQVSAQAFVSIETGKMAKGREGGTRFPLVVREDALAVVNKAIATIEAADEQARLDVLAQAAQVVNGAELEPALV
jgi:hypothetical protein